jgi:protein tyrosine phosphatase (PTP) superfamily phosphohydrolase (DUF442 family)
MRYLRWFPLLVVAISAASCSGGSSTPAPPTHAQQADDSQRVEAPGLHNVFRLTDRLYSGSSPEGDAGCQSLRQLGIKTIISVDGARPDLERAHRYGLRYVHLPIGYDGVPEQHALRIARAVRDLLGPVYIHCHHGKHRGPAAAAVVRLCLDDRCTVATAVAEMRRAGTDPRYTGLYAAPQQLHRPTADALDRVPADFPEVAQVPALAQVMVEIDDRWENLRQVRAAGWKTPRDHPDLDPPHEALLLAEQFREVARLAETEKRPAGYRMWLVEGDKALTELEGLLRRAPMDSVAVEAAYRQAGNSCSKCHAKYRDVPQQP